jgi:hypothetical protein
MVLRSLHHPAGAGRSLYGMRVNACLSPVALPQHRFRACVQAYGADSHPGTHMNEHDRKVNKKVYLSHNHTTKGWKEGRRPKFRILSMKDHQRMRNTVKLDKSLDRKFKQKTRRTKFTEIDYSWIPRKS